MLGLTPRSSGSVELEPVPLGKGGEGEVFSVKSHSIAGLLPADVLVAKTYFEPEINQRRDKLKAMISSPVAGEGVAWPQAMLFNDSKVFQGYLMHKLESKTNREWLYLANVKDRRQVAPDFDVRYALVAIRNLAAAILSVHAAGHRIGDINESNISVSATGTIFIVDTDSMQITADDGTIYPCTVGKPEYTAPELTHGSLRDHPRTSETDVFAFAVAAYQLLSGGATPHQGVFDPNNPDDPMSNVERIRKGILPSLDPNLARTFGFSPKPGVPVHAFPDFFREHIKGFLSVDPTSRISPTRNLNTLVRELDAYVANLEKCSQQKLHWHPRGAACEWCAEAATSGVDPWGTQTVLHAPKQVSLPAIGFDKGGSPQNLPNRAPAAVAGQQAHQANQYASGQPQQTQGQYSPQQYASQQQQSPAQAAPQRPAKIKGKVTVEYADGSWGQRPQLSQLFRQSPRFAIWAMKEETPGILKFWWPIERKLASPLGLILGLVLGAVFSAAWFFFSTMFAATMDPGILKTLVSYLGLAAVGTTFIATLILAFSALRDRARTKKKHGSLKNFAAENTGKTVLRFLPLGFFYGMPIVVILACLLVFGLTIFAKNVARA